jgi:hypothetical protein
MLKEQQQQVLGIHFLLCVYFVCSLMDRVIEVTAAQGAPRTVSPRCSVIP